MDMQIFIIGAGRIGTCFHRKIKNSILITRNSNWDKLTDAKPDSLILVCTRNDSLEDIIEATPKSLHSNLCFIQNGMLTGFLNEKGLEDSGRGLIYFAVPSVGEEPVVGAESVFSGPKVKALVDLLNSVGLSSKQLDRSTFEKEEMEKLIWNVCFGLLGDKYKVTVGEVLEGHRELTHKLVLELAYLANEGAGVSFNLESLWQRIENYSLEVSHYPTRVKEWKWRNQWFDDLIPKHVSRVPLLDKLHQEFRPPTHS
ncbi:MAG: ketopantoate reductase family protein [Bdellovibrionales bacterium]